MDRAEHDAKKAWLATQGVMFGDYTHMKLPERLILKDPRTWIGLNFYWCFKEEEIATMFKLVWGFR